MPSFVFDTISAFEFNPITLGINHMKLFVLLTQISLHVCVCVIFSQMFSFFEYARKKKEHFAIFPS